MSRARALRLGALLGVCLAALLVALLVGALGRWVALVAVAGVLLAVAEVALLRVLVLALPRQLDTVVGELVASVLLGQALLLVLVVRLPQLGGTARAVAVVAVVVFQLLRLLHAGAGHVVAQLGVPRAQVRGLPEVPALRSPRTPLVGEQGLLVLLAATGLPGLGLLVAAVTGEYGLVAPAAVAMVAVAVAVAVVAAPAPGLLVLLRRPRGPALVTAVQDAVLRHRPDVVLHSSGLAADLHWVTPWLDTLDEVGARGRPALVLVRDPEHFDLLPPSATPVLCLTEDRDVRGLTLPDTRVALYAANTPENTMLVRSPRLRSAFIGHGDSDKASSANPLSKMYDEVWVAGEAGRDRYLRADVGVRPERIRVVGRPQVRRIRPGAPLPPGAPCTVLYAPTWEGIYDDPTESSLLRAGVDVVRRLLAVDGVRVAYRPHPTTGARDARFSRADEQVRALLAKAGAPHAVVEASTTDLPTSVNDADVLVTDVTSVISDFLASGKPYAVVNGSDLDDAAFRQKFPSTAGAWIVGRGGEGLEEAVADARGPDVMRGARDELRVQLIGPATDDPVGLFDEAIQALGDTLRPRTAGTGARGAASTDGMADRGASIAGRR